MKVADSDKHSGLLRYGIKYRRKNLYGAGPTIAFLDINSD